MAKHTSTIATIATLLALGACVVTPEGRQLQSSEAQYKVCLQAGGTCEREQRIFEADRELYNAYTARGAAQPSTQCIYGNGIISCN